MTMSRRITSVSDRTLSRLMRVGVLVLVIGVAAFGTIYYQDQHVNAGPSLVNRQITTDEAAVRTAPNNVAARLSLAADYQSAKRSDDALAQYDVILKADKGNRAALLGSGLILIAKGELSAATTAYKAITGVATTGEFSGADPQLEEAYYYLGSIAVTQGKNTEAITELHAALRITPTDSDSLYLLGVANLRNGATKLAVTELGQALQFVPMGWCQPFSELTQAYKKLGETPKAAYASAMADSCTSPAKATAQLKTLTKGPEAVESMLALAMLAQTDSSNGQTGPANAQAISWYQKVLTIDHTNAVAIANLKALGAGTIPGKTGPSPAAASSSTTQGPS
jgi:tetratricopeptide (TPR) repeat protein